tara:strand:- start:69 stop:425 length:357 start_codon:yes stop_codon:yes gene_type:complete
MNYNEFKQWLADTDLYYKDNSNFIEILDRDIKYLIDASVISVANDSFYEQYDRITVRTGEALFYNDDQIVASIAFHVESTDSRDSTIAKLQSDLDRANKIIDNLCRAGAIVHGREGGE